MSWMQVQWDRAPCPASAVEKAKLSQHCWYGLSCVSTTRPIFEVLIPVSQNVTLYGEKTFIKVIRLKRGHKSGPYPIRAYRKGGFGYGDPYRRKVMGRQREKMPYSQAKERGLEQIFPHRNQPCWLRCRTSGLQNWETVHFCCEATG